MSNMNLGEKTEYIEFKKSTGELKEAIISMVAMLNKHECGEVYFGVKNDGTVIGQNITDRTLREISQAAKAHIMPAVYPTIEKKIIDDARTVVHVSVQGYSRPYLAYNIPRIRVADEDLIMDQDTYAEMLRWQKDKNLSWEKRVSDYRIADIDKEAYKIYLNRAKQTGRMSFLDDRPEQVLPRMNLTNGDKLLNAGAALFVESPINEVQMAKYATDERLNFSDIRRYTGSILSLVRKAEQYLLDAINWRVEFDGSMNRKEIPEIPVGALREALINAFAHREIESGQAIDIAVYPSKLEIYSPGVFPAKLSPRDYIDGNEHPLRRNPLIARTLYYSKDMENFATGLKRIQKLCDEANCKVEYNASPYGFSVIFYRKTNTPQVTPQVKYNVDMNAKEKALLEFCQCPKALQEMMEFMGLVDRKHFRKRYLQPMLKNGWLKMTIPAAPRSSLQRYVADVHDLTGGSAE